MSTTSLLNPNEDGESGLPMTDLTPFWVLPRRGIWVGKSESELWVLHMFRSRKGEARCEVDKLYVRRVLDIRDGDEVANFSRGVLPKNAECELRDEKVKDVGDDAGGLEAASGEFGSFASGV
ncbi:hypothetical protein LTR95_009409 [Oleoguttula sp. CCFEE 5521]